MALEAELLEVWEEPRDKEETRLYAQAVGEVEAFG